MAGKTTIPTSKAVQKATLTDDELTAFLQGSGAIASPPPQTVSRIKVNGSVFVVGDQMYPYNVATNAPAMLVRITEPIIEYQGFWFTAKEAGYAGRPDIIDRFCKSYFAEPSQARKFAQDGTECGTCPFAPWVKDPPLDGKKCSWRGELKVQIIPESGELDGDEPIYSLDLSFTGMIEFVGSSFRDADHSAGHVSTYNFMHKLAKLGAESSPDDPKAGVIKALTSYQLGGVVAEARLLAATSTDKSKNWVVPSFEPIHIIDMGDAPTEAQALEAGEDPGPRNVTPKQVDGEDYSDLPF